MDDQSKLPDDIQLCHQMINELMSELEKKDKLTEKLQHQLEQLLRHRYGQRSDRVNPNQPALFDLGKPKQPETPMDRGPTESTAKSKKKRKGHGRKRLPQDLPRRRIVHDLSAQEKICPHCGTECECIGEETSEQLEYIPASMVVLVHARKKYACKKCEGNMAIADKPFQPIEKGLPGPGLLSHVVTGKYADHLPLNRQEGILARQGVDISRKTMCGWCKSAADLLLPLYELMKKSVLQSRVIHTDDTPIKVLDPKSTKTKTGRLWVYIGDADYPYTIFDYTPSRRRDGPMNFLYGFKGYLQADAYAGYDRIYAPGDVVEVACWAHARRKFVDAKSSDPTRAFAAIAWIKKLYKIEDEIKNLKAAYNRRARQERSKPLLDSFGEWLRDEQMKVLPKSPIAAAIGYTLSNWDALNVYVTDCDLAIDNNNAERAIRPIAVGRRNWLFAGSDHGGMTAAILMSFTGTCKSLGLDPFAYLRDVFTVISETKTTDLPQLLPDNYKSLL
jgi:transposase